MILFLFFLAAIGCTVIFNQPVFLAISLGTSFVYSVYLKGKKAFFFNVIQCALWGIYPFIYASYNHFGITDVFVNFIGNKITVESFCYGVSVAARGGAVVMWFECLYQVFSSDKVGYLLGRVSAKLALYFSILLRTVPQVREQFKKISAAQRCIGKGVYTGSVFTRIKNGAAIVSSVITWLMEQFVETTKSMNNRGYQLKGKTVFSIYRFDNRDRTLVIWMFLLFSVILAGHELEQTCIVYDPEIILYPITGVTCIFYAAYAIFCLFPMILEITNACRFAKAIQQSMDGKKKQKG